MYGPCLPVEAVDDAGNPTKEVGYYTLGQVSQFVPAGARHIYSTAEAGDLDSVAFETCLDTTCTTRRLVLVVLNDTPFNPATTSSPPPSKPFTIEWRGETLSATIPASSVQTYTWNTP